MVNCEHHVISSFILTDFLLLASYLFGLYLFSHGETEYLSNLADKVFIKNAMAKQGKSWCLCCKISANGRRAKCPLNELSAFQRFRITGFTNTGVW